MDRRHLTFSILLAVATACELTPESKAGWRTQDRCRHIHSPPATPPTRSTPRWSLRSLTGRWTGLFTVMGDTTRPYAPYEVYVEDVRSGSDRLAEHTKHSGDRCRLVGEL